MACYPHYIRYFIVLVAILYALTDGSLCCAHFQCPHSAPSDPYDPVYNDDDQPAVRSQHDVDESVNLLRNLSADFCSVTVEVPLEMVGFCNTTTVCFSAFSLRLHLFYRLLLI